MKYARKAQAANFATLLRGTRTRSATLLFHSLHSFENVLPALGRKHNSESCINDKSWNSKREKVSSMNVLKVLGD